LRHTKKQKSSLTNGTLNDNQPRHEARSEKRATTRTSGANNQNKGASQAPERNNMKTTIINNTPVRCWDAGNRVADRYTALYTKHGHKGLSGGRGMSAKPTHPQGIGLWIEARAGQHLGKRVTFDNLPIDCQNLITSDLS
jgi:hypothetical protein